MLLKQALDIMIILYSSTKTCIKTGHVFIFLSKIGSKGDISLVWYHNYMNLFKKLENIGKTNMKLLHTIYGTGPIFQQKFALIIDISPISRPWGRELGHILTQIKVKLPPCRM